MIDEDDMDLLCFPDPEQDNDPLSRIVTVLIDIGKERNITGVSKRYNTKFPTAQMKLIDVDLRYHRIIDNL